MQAKFSIYNYNLIMSDETIITRKFIVVKLDQGLIFTNFHKYVLNPKKRVRKDTDSGYNRFDFVAKFLTYAFFDRGLKNLDSLTVEIVKDFLNGYGMGTLPGDSKGRTKSTVEQCIMSVLDFLENFTKDRKGHCKIKKDDLFTTVPIRNKRGVTIQKKVPIFDVCYKEKTKDIFRDIPNKAFDLLFAHIAENHMEIFMLVCLSAFAGLRPAEACNVRRIDSPLGPGIIIETSDGEVRKISIDLRKEYNLRSDHIRVGAIKKEKMRHVHIFFTDALAESYNKYMAYMDGRKYESDYGALTVNKQGKAMTYQSYYEKFHKIIKEEMIPIYLGSDEPEVVIFGKLLMENNMSPHVFRHWFTVQLVLNGVDNVGELMSARGDTSPESALTYLKNKGELEKQYRKVSNEAFDYLMWAVKQKRNNR